VQHFHISENLPRAATAECTAKVFSGAISYWVPRKYSQSLNDTKLRQNSLDGLHIVAAARAWNIVTVCRSYCCVNPAFIPSSPENSSIHRIFPTIY